jgi:hypothetical protein
VCVCVCVCVCVSVCVCVCVCVCLCVCSRLKTAEFQHFCFTDEDTEVQREGRCLKSQSEFIKGAGSSSNLLASGPVLFRPLTFPFYKKKFPVCLYPRK